MGLKKLFVIAVLAGAMSVLGCGDDETGGTGNTGGDGATGGAGATGGSGGGTAGNGGSGGGVFCDGGLCVEPGAARDACLAGVDDCLLLPELQQDECILGVEAAICEDIG